MPLDDIAVERERLAKALGKAVDFFKTPYMQHLFLLQAALQPEQELMAHALKMSSVAWELVAMQMQEQHGWSSYRVLTWHDGVHLETFFQETFRNLFSATLWEDMVQTEETWSTIVRNSLRPAAAIWMLVYVRTKSCPFSLFKLLAPMGLVEWQEVAEKLLQTPVCLRDSFATHFLALFGDQPSLLSERARQVLSCVASQMSTNTYSVERCHSRNARRARHRVHTHVADARAIALTHQGFAGPEWAYRALGKAHKRDRERPAAAAGPRQRHKRRRGGGGAWRSYLSHHLKNRKWTGRQMHLLAQRYRRFRRTGDAKMESNGQSRCTLREES